jgi:hypothetical protein
VKADGYFPGEKNARLFTTTHICLVSTICNALQDFTTDLLFLVGGNTDVYVVRIAQQSGNTFCLVTHKKRRNHWRPSHKLRYKPRSLPLADLGESPALLRQGCPRYVYVIVYAWNKRKAFRHISNNIPGERFWLPTLNKVLNSVWGAEHKFKFNNKLKNINLDIWLAVPHSITFLLLPT